jgi:hypothetical protein
MNKKNNIIPFFTKREKELSLDRGNQVKREVWGY